MTYKRTLSLYRSPKAALILSSTLLLRGASYLCLPFMTVLLFKETTLPAYAIGIIVGLYQLGSVGAGLVSGILSDKLGRRVILLIGLYGSTTVYLLFFILINYHVGGSSFSILFSTLNLGLGISSAFYHPVTQAILADSVPKEDRGLAFQHRYVLISIGATIGPPLGVYFGSISQGMAFLVVGMLHLAFSIFFSWLNLTFTASPEKVSFRGAIGVLASDRVFRFILLSGFFFVLATSQLDSNLSEIIVNRFKDGVALFSLILSINAAAVFTLQPIIGMLTQNWPLNRAILIGMFVLIFANLLFYLFGSTKIAFIMFNVAIMIASMLVIPVMSVAIDEIAPEHLRGTYFGAATLRNLGQALGPATGGVAASLFGSGALFIFMGLCGLAASFALLKADKEKKSILHAAHQHIA